MCLSVIISINPCLPSIPAFGSDPSCSVFRLVTVSTNFIPDRSRPGLTTTAIGAVDLQGAGGNWATVGRRSKGGRRVRRQREKRKGKSVGLRIGTLNVGTMTGKGRELADVMERRKVDILCVQETRWKGSKARSIGAGFKLFYYGVDSKRNGVGVVLKEEFVRNLLEVKRVSDRVMSLKLEIEGVMLNVVSGYAPQVGCELEEKERFWSELDEVMESIPTGERVVIGADFNGHVGEGNTGDEEVMGKFGVKERNLEGQMVVDFAKRMDMGVVNTYFQKREEHRVTYKSGGRRTQVVLPDDWETTAEVIRETGRKVLGVSSGRRKEDKETWWWNEEVQDSIQRKRLAKKKWDMDRTEENRQEYKELQRRVKREVSKAKQKAYEELYTRLDTREGEKDLYRLARQRDRDGKDMQQKVDKIRKDEVRKALKRMKSGKAVGPDDIPVEVWKCLGEAAVEFLANLFNRVLENLEKAYDRVPREELWYCMRKSGVAEKYVRVVQDMYERSRTVVRCAVGQTEEFNVEVGLHQGSALSPFLFAMVMDQLSEEVEENLERWRFALERRGMKVSRIQSNGECGKEKISARIKGKVYRTVVRPAMLYGLETVSLRKRQESELEVAELKMLSGPSGDLAHRNSTPPTPYGTAPDTPTPPHSPEEFSVQENPERSKEHREATRGGGEEQGEASGGNEEQGEAGDGSEEQGEAGDGSEEHGEVSGGSEEQGEASGGSDGHGSKARRSQTTSTAEQEGRATSTAEQEGRATSTAEQEG
ncbi:hypothetical protein QTP70_003438 [Hemibagrus guttatus]|uniref:Reverse transcriptase domain-containing protein n=1 Tax=Hemibagrus guttatus TaxID=175788 RepID=A0AAE0UX17_9TELE|nr:hypothetical protein QTP70_003438 [Hemibagrus guttatus]